MSEVGSPSDMTYIKVVTIKVKMEEDENAAEPESGAGDGSHIDQCFPTPPPPDNVLISPMRTRLTLG